MKESVLRTIVPIVYALLIKAGLGQIGVDDATVQSLAALLATGLLYVALRVAERYRKEIGWLLGWAKQPVYVKGEVVRKQIEAVKPVVEAARDATKAGELPDRPTSVIVPSAAEVEGKHVARG